MNNPDQIYASRDLLALLWTELVKHLPASIALVIILSLANPGTLSVEASSRSATQIEQMPGDTGESGIEIGSSSEIYPLPPGTEVAEIDVAGDALVVRTVDGKLLVLRIDANGNKTFGELFSSGVDGGMSVAKDGKVAFSLRWPHLNVQGLVIWSPDSNSAAIHKIPMDASIGAIKLVEGGLVVYELTLNGITSLYYAFLDANGHISSGPIDGLLETRLAGVSGEANGLAVLGSLINNPGGDSDLMDALITWSSVSGKFQHNTTSGNLLLFESISSVGPDLYSVLSAESGLYGAIVDGDTVRIKRVVDTETLETLELPSIYLNGIKPTKLFVYEVSASAIPGQTGAKVLVVSAIGENGELEQRIFSNGKTWQLMPAGTELGPVNTLDVTGDQPKTASVVGSAVEVKVTSPKPEMAFFPILTYPPDRQDLKPEVSQ